MVRSRTNLYYLDIYLTSQSFLPFTSLHTLSIDSTYLTNELLQCFAQQPTPLKRYVYFKQINKY
jgi:hypothetical protein